MIYLSSIKTKLAINFLEKKNLLHLAEKRAGLNEFDLLLDLMTLTFQK